MHFEAIKCEEVHGEKMTINLLLRKKWFLNDA